jgi:hypothetical protein
VARRRSAGTVAGMALTAGPDAPSGGVTPTGGPPLVRSLDELPFDNRFVAALPADEERSPRRRQVAGAAYSWVEPTPVAAPRTVAWSPEVAAQLGLDPAVCESDDFAQVFAGNRVPAGAQPHALAYGGHQFGSWAGQLGTAGPIAPRRGRTTVTAGTNAACSKGAGARPPYPRTAGTGRACLGSLSEPRGSCCSEACTTSAPHHPGPARRLTGTDVLRDVPLRRPTPAPSPAGVVGRGRGPSVHPAPSAASSCPASRGTSACSGPAVETTIGLRHPPRPRPPGRSPDQVAGPGSGRCATAPPTSSSTGCAWASSTGCSTPTTCRSSA